MLFGPAYQQVRQHLIYKQGRPKPRSLKEINGSRLEITAGSSQAETLRLVRERPADIGLGRAPAWRFGGAARRDVAGNAID